MEQLCQEAAALCRQKFELIRGPASLPVKCSTAGTVVLMHSPWGKTEKLISEVCQHKDAMLICILPADPRDTFAGEMKLNKEIEEVGLGVGQARRLTCMLKGTLKDVKVAVQHVLLISAKDQDADTMVSMGVRQRITKSKAWEQCWLQADCSYTSGPKGENGHMLWNAPVSTGWLRALMTGLDAWPKQGEHFCEIDPHLVPS